MADARTTLITGIGLASSVGDAIMGSAAIRAGITRPQKLGVFVGVDDEPEPAELSGHPVAGCTEGTFFLGRWIRLAHRALDDLASRGDLPHLDDVAGWTRTALVVAVPDDLPGRFSVPERIDDAYLTERYIGRVVQLLSWPLAPAQIRWVRRGHVGAIAGLVIALEELAEGRYDRVIVLAADSLIETKSLAWLDKKQQLKTPARAVGVVPGEAAACVMIEDPRAARSRNARPQAYLESVAAHESQQPESRDGRGLGPAWAGAIEEALRRAGVRRPFDGDMVCDLNGSEQRAHDFGMAQLLLNQKRLTAPGKVRFPATALGETGAASGAVALVMGVRALARGESQRSSVLVTSRDDQGHVGAACLGRVPRSSRW
jgi:3-oxoacyl-[acyl-carrier-protein] synthase-1